MIKIKNPNDNICTLTIPEVGLRIQLKKDEVSREYPDDARKNKRFMELVESLGLEIMDVEEKAPKPKKGSGKAKASQPEESQPEADTEADTEEKTDESNEGSEEAGSEEEPVAEKSEEESEPPAEEAPKAATRKTRKRRSRK